jgi:CubicO group peptidase (beta-lactamase class C family)
MHDASVGADFSGVIRIDHDDETVFEQSYGAADRARGIPNTVDTQFAIASGGKGLTAVAVVQLIEAGALEWSTTAPYHDLVVDRVCAVAGMPDTRFLRLDEPVRRAAVGYLDADGARTNVLHLPVRGNGDGGVFTTLADMHSFWRAFFADRLTTAEHRADMVKPRGVGPAAMRYGLGFLAVPDRRRRDAGGIRPGCLVQKRP